MGDPLGQHPLVEIINVRWDDRLLCVSVLVSRIFDEEADPDQARGPFECVTSMGTAIEPFGHIYLSYAKYEVRDLQQLAKDRSPGSTWQEGPDIIPTDGFYEGEEEGDHIVTGYPKEESLAEWEWLGGQETDIAFWNVRFEDLEGSDYLLDGEPVESPVTGVTFKSVLTADIEVKGWAFTTGPQCLTIIPGGEKLLTASLPSTIELDRLMQDGSIIVTDTLSCSGFRYEIEGHVYRPVAAAKQPITDLAAHTQELFLLLEPV